MTKPQARDTGRAHKVQPRSGQLPLHPTVIELPHAIVFNDGSRSKWVLIIKAACACGKCVQMVYTNEEGSIYSGWFANGQFDYKPLPLLLVELGFDSQLAPPPHQGGYMMTWLAERQAVA